jgi:hypothetical protein
MKALADSLSGRKKPTGFGRKGFTGQVNHPGFGLNGTPNGERQGLRPKPRSGRVAKASA